MTADIVSVIIPCYKQTQYLQQAIYSVLQQTYPHYEVIVVDDGSPDDVEAVVRHFKEERVKLIKQPNRGVAVARNNGMLASIGKYIIFLDSDDRLLPNALQEGVGFLEKHQHCAYVSGFVQLINQEGSLIVVPAQQHVEEDHFKVLLRTNYIWTPGAVMYRKSILETRRGFDPTAGGSADYELNIRLAREFPVGCHGQVILDYRRHQNSMSVNSGYMLMSGVKVRRRMLKLLKGDAGLVEACKEGIRIVQNDVGVPLIKHVEEKMAAGESLLGLYKDMWYLLNYFPKGIQFLLRRWI